MILQKISNIIYFLSDICWVQVLNGFIARTRFLVSFLNITNAVVLSLITGFWFIYVELSQGEKYITKTRHRIYTLLPAMVSTFLNIVLFVFFPNTVMDGEYNIRPLYNFKLCQNVNQGFQARKLLRQGTVPDLRRLSDDHLGIRRRPDPLVQGSGILLCDHAHDPLRLYRFAP